MVIESAAECVRRLDEEREQIANRAKSFSSQEITELAKANCKILIVRYMRSKNGNESDVLQKYWEEQEREIEQFYFCLLAGMLRCEVKTCNQMNGVRQAHYWIKYNTDMESESRTIMEAYLSNREE